MTDASGEDEREIELSSIAAIFPELVLDSKNPFTASIDISVSPASPISVLFSSPSIDGAFHTNLPTPPSSDNDDNPRKPNSFPQDDSLVHQLSYLPPLHLQLTLPDGYPAEHPPEFHLSAHPSWLPNDILQRLIEEGNALWEEYGHCQVVFAYIDLLHQAAERGFDVRDSPTGRLEVPAELEMSLLDFDRKTKRDKFEQETFECGVCLEPKKGSVCYRLLRCGHVFCVPCLQDFYNNCIKEGDVSNVKCLAPDCGKPAAGTKKRKSEKTLNPSELLQIPLEESVVKRYVELKRKKKLESDKSTVYCPRKWCQGPARSKKYPKVTDLVFVEDSDSESEEAAPVFTKDTEESKLPPAAERLCVCENCDYAFCRVCLSGWHGEFARCWPRSTAELTAEEKASYDYIRQHTTPCPTCASPCQKTHGCNHMNCFQCRTHFCYLCSGWLDPADPYKHFNNIKSNCFQRLWELEEGDEGAGNVRFEGARGWEAAIAAADEADARVGAPDAAAVPPPALAVPPPPAAPALPRMQPQPPLPPHPRPPRLPENFEQMIHAMIENIRVVGLDAAMAEGQDHWLQDFQDELDAYQQEVATREQLREQQHRERRHGAGALARMHQRPGGRGMREAVVRVEGQARNAHGQAQGALRGQDPAQGRRQPQGQAQGQGLRRFLDMVERDEEDEWDSDELEEGDEAFVIPVR